MSRRKEYWTHMPWKTGAENSFMIKQNTCTCKCPRVENGKTYVHMFPFECEQAHCKCCCSTLSWNELQKMEVEFEKKPLEQYKL